MRHGAEELGRGDRGDRERSAHAADERDDPDHHPPRNSALRHDLAREHEERHRQQRKIVEAAENVGLDGLGRDVGDEQHHHQTGHQQDEENRHAKDEQHRRQHEIGEDVHHRCPRHSRAVLSMLVFGCRLPGAREQTQGNEQAHDGESDRHERLRNDQRKISGLAALVERPEIPDHRGGKKDNRGHGCDKEELGEEIECGAHTLGQHAHDDVHADVPAGPGDGPVAKEHAAHHEEQHGLLRPRDGGAEEIAADDVGKIEPNTRDQRDGGERADGGQQRAHAEEHVGDHLLRFADSNTVITALFKSGLVFDRSAPMLTTLSINSDCSASGSLISSPPRLDHILYWSEKNSLTKGTMSCETFLASSCTIFCKSGGNDSNHFLLISMIETRNGCWVSVTYFAASWNCIVVYTVMEDSDASIAPCWRPGSTSASVIATGDASMRLIISSWNCEASTRIFMPL